MPKVRERRTVRELEFEVVSVHRTGVFFACFMLVGHSSISQTTGLIQGRSLLVLKINVDISKRRINHGGPQAYVG